MSNDFRSNELSLICDQRYGTGDMQAICDIIQACVWRIDLSDVEKIELLNDDKHIYGSLNYKRSNGKRINWRKEFYKSLK